MAKQRIVKNPKVEDGVGGRQAGGEREVGGWCRRVPARKSEKIEVEVQGRQARGIETRRLA